MQTTFPLRFGMDLLMTCLVSDDHTYVPRTSLLQGLAIKWLMTCLRDLC